MLLGGGKAAREPSPPAADGEAPHPDADSRRQREIVDAFVAGVRVGDFDALLAVLDPDVILRSGRGPGAPRKIRGARAVAEQARSYSRLAQSVEPVPVNGAAGIVSRLRVDSRFRSRHSRSDAVQSPKSMSSVIAEFANT